MSNTKGAKPKQPARSDSRPVCPNCGARTEEQLYLGRKRVCGECIDDALHPLEKTELRFGPMLKASFVALGLLGMPALLVTWALSAPIGLMHLYLDDPSTGSTLYQLVVGFFYQGLVTELALQRLDGVKTDWGRALRHGLTRYFPLVLASLIKQIRITVLLLTVFFGVRAIIDYLLVEVLVVSGEADGADGLYKSQRMMRGHRGVGLGVLLMFSPLLLASLAWVSIEMDPAVARAQGLTLEVALLATFIAPLLQLVAFGPSLAFFARLRRARRAEPSQAEVASVS